MTAAGEDTLSDARQAGRWLSTLTRDYAEACDEMAGALRKARARCGRFSIESQRPLPMARSTSAYRCLSTTVRLLALDEIAAPGAAPDASGIHAALAASAVDAGARSDAPPVLSGRQPALLLGTGAGRYARVRQSVLVFADDYVQGRTYYCETRRNRYNLTLDKVLDRHDEYVWAAIRVAKIGPVAR